MPVVGAPLLWGSSPTLADLDGDGRLEILLGGRDLDGSGNLGCGGWVYAYRYDGSLLWQTHVRAPINSTPTAADLNGDGYLDVVASLGGVSEGTQCWHGGVIALDGRNGQELWTFDTQDWLNHVHDGWLDGVISTPAIADIDGDDQLEIAFGAWDQCIYLLDRNGQPLWGNLPGLVPGTYCGGHGFYNEDTIWSSPALADLTGDGRLEIIIGADVTAGNWWGDPTGGYLYVFDADGNNLAREWVDQAIFSSPAVGDLDNDGKNEIAVGTGTYLPGKGYYVSAFNYDPHPTDPADRLVLKWRAVTAGRVFASPALADLDGDGKLDVVISSLIGDWGEDGSLIYAWRGYDGAEFFHRRNCNYVGQTGNTLSSPSVADIDGDGQPEILFSSLWEVDILNHDGTYYTDYSNPRWSGSPVHPGCARDVPPTTELTYWARYSLYASPAVGDLDGDGDAEIVIGGHNPNNPSQGMIFAWTGQPPDSAPAWPTWRHDERHSGNAIFELIPPTSQAQSPAAASGPFSVTWTGYDATSGISHYTIQVRDNGRAWTDWLTNETDTAATYRDIQEGHTYRFRSIAHDRAGNVETKSTADTETVVARHVVGGAVYDQRERPIAGAGLDAQPPALNQAITDKQGGYLLGLPSDGSYDLTVSHPRFGLRPPMKNLTVTADLTNLDFYLPPPSNLIVNGDFEGTDGWQTSGPTPPVPVRDRGHSGDFALEIGEFSAPLTAPVWTVSQTVVISQTAVVAVLDWLYRVGGEVANDDSWTVTVGTATAAITISQALPLTHTTWTHGWLDLTPFIGQEVTVAFRLERTAAEAPLLVWLDEVSLGVTYPTYIYLPLLLKAP